MFERLRQIPKDIITSTMKVGGLGTAVAGITIYGMAAINYRLDVGDYNQYAREEDRILREMDEINKRQFSPSNSDRFEQLDREFDIASTKAGVKLDDRIRDINEQVVGIFLTMGGTTLVASGFAVQERMRRKPQTEPSNS